MNARLHWWLHEWDWRPLARTIVWLAIAASALKRSGWHPPSVAAITRELTLGCVLTFGLLTRLQLWLAMLALRLLMAIDDWTYAACDLLIRPVAGGAPFAIRFLAAFAVQAAALIAATSWVLTKL